MKFLKKLERDNIKNKKMYRGSIPWNLILSNKKKIIYISTSNRNLENYHSMIELYNNDEQNKKIYTNIFENTSLSQEDITGINIDILEILKNQKEFILFFNLQITLDVFFESIKYYNLSINNEYSMNEILAFLQENGYENSYLIEKKGDYSKRGDIIDIYPPNFDNPIRLEFFDTELESIRIFDINSQRSIERIESIKIYGNKTNGNEYELIELMNELNQNDIQIIMENEDLLNYKLEEYIMLNDEKRNLYRERFKRLHEKSDVIETLIFSDDQIETFKNKEKLEKLSEIKRIEIYTNNYEQKKLEYINMKNIFVFNSIIFEGFIENDLVVLSDRELDGYIYEKKQKSLKSIKYKKVNQIMIGDYVIHVQYGVGLYKGITTIDNRDYLEVQYADQDVLYIPVEKLDRLEKYITYGEEPKLYKLGTRGFKRKKQKLEEEIIKFATELIEIQAKRQQQNGFIYGKDTVWQEDFEMDIPFELTEGQKKVIKEVKEDMESPHIMDRIVCGDVGYGKTEVAMRASFKAVENGKQVALIAPTTVLAEQHYQRFKQRFEKYPVTIENLSRLTKNKSSTILKELKNGTIDIVIGTHRLLSDDVEFNNLGMLIIDEEQKFGVKAKEKIKQKRNNVDILTLTATPIPRTLNLALLGIRDISIIETPPANRLPIITQIMDYDKNKIKENILKELSRDGQVFYLYNDVRTIKEKLKELKEILPSFVKIDYIHGQLPIQEIKNKLRNFEEGYYDILIATVIIENGIDVPNANTILIENYTNLGLSQIYQLRGRVGRSNRQGYCYLINKRKLTEKGKKKEESMKNVEGIQSGGFQLSLEDMKIRGAGEILGDRQHGSIETFGYDLYIKMLNEELKKQKGLIEEKIENVEINLKEKGYIPEEYIQGTERLNTYKRFALCNSYDELSELTNEICDIFGKIPNSMEKFIKSVKLKIFAENNMIQRIEENENSFNFWFVNEDLKKIDELSLYLNFVDITMKVKNKLLGDNVAKEKFDYIIKQVKKDIFNNYIDIIK